MGGSAELFNPTILEITIITFYYILNFAQTACRMYNFVYLFFLPSFSQICVGVSFLKLSNSLILFLV